MWDQNCRPCSKSGRTLPAQSPAHHRCLRRFRLRRNTEPLRPDRIIRPWPSHPAPQCVGAVLCGANQNFRKEPQIRKADSGCQTLAFWIQRQCTKSRRRAGIEIEREPIGIILHEVCADQWMHVQFVREQMKRPGRRPHSALGKNFVDAPCRPSSFAAPQAEPNYQPRSLR